MGPDIIIVHAAVLLLMEYLHSFANHTSSSHLDTGKEIQYAPVRYLQYKIKELVVSPPGALAELRTKISDPHNTIFAMCTEEG